MTLLTFLIDLLRRINIFAGRKAPKLASYSRELPVNLERMFENALDGEHLPWLHSSTFATLEISQSGAWGWRGAGYLQPRSRMTWMELELRLDRDTRRWVTKTLRGLGKGSEIVTEAIPLDENRIKVVVDFYVPGLPRFLHRRYAKQYIETYTRLYDEDLAMMRERQQQLDAVALQANGKNTTQLSLGPLADIAQQLPMLFEFSGREYRLLQIDGELLAHATTCPHMLGPLRDAEIRGREISCPWHGYRFDIKTGACTSGQRCNLPPAPDITVNASGEVLIKRVRSNV